MQFNSISYCLFFAITFCVFYGIPDRWRWLLLLIVSYGFYSALGAPYLLAALLMVTLISYACGVRMAACPEGPIKKRWLSVGILLCLLILFVLKYVPILMQRFGVFVGTGETIHPNIIAVGVSYFTFQGISYLLDVYLSAVEPEPDLRFYALHISFFPKLLQGPIERAGDLLPQLKKPYLFDYDLVRSGLLLFALGLLKKVVVADRLALYANQIYNNVHSYTGLNLVVGTYAYALQIYFDFSAYTDMARGTAQVFGINLSENFNAPYRAISVSDFWRRWHISFSRWILDYIFKPLQMEWRNWGKVGASGALIVTFLVSGVWHGATKCFIVWGLLHGAYLSFSLYVRPYQIRFDRWCGVEYARCLKYGKVFVTFNLICFAWIFFRSSSLGNAWYLISHSVKLWEGFGPELLLSQGKNVLVVTIVALLAMTWVDSRKFLAILDRRLCFRWTMYCIISLSIIMFEMQSQANFLYFKF